MGKRPPKRAAHAALRASAKRCSRQFRHSANLIDDAVESAEPELAAEYATGAVRALAADLARLRQVVRAYRSAQ